MPILELAEEKEQVNFVEEDEDQDNEVDADRNRRSELKEISGIVVAGTDWTTATILDQLVRENIQLNPRFQRRDAWTIIRKSRFIESIILGFPIPQIVLASNQKERGKFIVLDGKQRLLTILQFYGQSETPNDSFTLKGLEFRPELNGYKYQDIKSHVDVNINSIVDALDNQTIRTTLIRNWSTESFLYKIFLRLNLETTPLYPQELRQALHPGDFVNFLDDQSMESQGLKKILKSNNPDFRMRDVELLLRYVAFHYFLPDYRSNLKQFLNMTCEKLNQDWKNRENEIRDTVSQFENAVQTTIDIFGEKNFSRVWVGNNYRSQFNRAILDVMVFYFSDPIIREVANNHKIQIENAFKQLCSSPNSEFRESVERTTKNLRETHTRLSLWGKVLLDVLNVEFNIPELIDNRIIFNGLR